MSLIHLTRVPQAGLCVFSEHSPSSPGVAGRPPGTERDRRRTGPDVKSLRGDAQPDRLGAAVGEAQTWDGAGAGARRGEQGWAGRS